MRIFGSTKGQSRVILRQIGASPNLSPVGTAFNDSRDGIKYLLYSCYRLSQNKLSIQVGGEMELKSAVEGLLNNRGKMTEIGEKGYRVIIKNRGALQKNLELIEDIINQKIKVKDLNTNGTNGRISRIKF